MTIPDLLAAFASESLFDASGKFLKYLGVKTSAETEDPIPFLELYEDAAKDASAEVPKPILKLFRRVEKTYFVGTVTDDTLSGNQASVDFKGASAQPKYEGMFVFAVQMRDGETLTRGEAAILTRGINRVVRQQPATVLILEKTHTEARRHGEGEVSTLRDSVTPCEIFLSVATCERTTYKQTWRPGEKLGKVSILKGVNCLKPHRGHIDILESMNVGKCKTFDTLYEQWQKVFSTSILTEKFYQELLDWYVWASDEDTDIYFPNDPDDENDDYDGRGAQVIRLITRILFVWFIKQKGLVPDKLFDIDYLKTVLKDFDPEASDSGVYYNAILQNLFFATLNRAIEDEDGKRRFADAKEQVDIKNLYRYAEFFSISQDQVVEMFSEIPFVNGSLFDCLDKTKGNDGVDKAYYRDGFSRNDRKLANGHFKYRAFIPNELFFNAERGLFPLFERYNFTVEENTPLDQQVALDPELLGKVFENLLGVYNGETTREDSGSFYTPREIVDHMVDETLIAYLGDSKIVRDVFSPSFVYREIDEQKYDDIVHKLKQIKLLDPACGSGAFPVGFLNRMVEIIQRLKAAETNSPSAIYKLKKFIIENCIYGSDIQCVASQITKLRFFISLIVNCNKDLSNPKNFGIPELPNLETKFVAANSLMRIKKSTGGWLEDPNVNAAKDELRQIRHDHFNARTLKVKRRMVRKDREVRKRLFDLLNGSLYQPDDAWQLVEWNPYDQNLSAPFFDPEWMFGIKDGFDVVIGNPPYVSTKGRSDEDKAALENEYGFADDLYYHFIIRGYELLKDGGIQSLITSDTYFTTATKEGLRKLMLDNELVRLIHWGHGIFDSAMVSTATFVSRKAKPAQDFKATVVDMKGRKSLADGASYQIEEDVYRHSINGAIFVPSELNIQINERFSFQHSALLKGWWDRIKTSRDIAKNVYELKHYRDALQFGDLTLAGLVTDGGQGLATGDNGRYVGVRKGTKAAENVLVSRPKKLDEFNRKNKTSYALPADEFEIWDLFDRIKAKYGRRAFGKGYIYRIVADSLLVDLSTLSDECITKGFPHSNAFIPYDKGDKEGNRWYLETPYVIDWSRDSVRQLESDPNARFQNTKFYFWKGFCYSDIKTFFIRCRMKGVSVHDVKSMSLFPVSEAFPYYYLITLINSHLTATIVYNFLNNTPSFQINDCRMLPILVPTAEQLKDCKELFDSALAIQKDYFAKTITSEDRDKKLQDVQDKVDEFVYKLYGIDTTAYLNHSNTVYDVAADDASTEDDE